MRNDPLILKRIDFYGQAAIALVPAMLSVFNFSLLSVSLFGLGLWQLVSFFLSIGRKARWYKRRSRKIYGNALAFLGLVGLAGLVSRSGLFVFLLLLAAAAFVLGFYYFFITTEELRSLRISMRHRDHSGET